MFKIWIDACSNLGDEGKMGPPQPHGLSSSGKHLSNITGSSKLYPITDRSLKVKTSIRYWERVQLHSEQTGPQFSL